MNDLVTLGFASATHQRDPRILRIGLDTIAQLDAANSQDHIRGRVVLTLNGLPYFESGDIIDAVAFLAEREAVQAAAEAGRDE